MYVEENDDERNDKMDRYNNFLGIEQSRSEPSSRYVMSHCNIRAHVHDNELGISSAVGLFDNYHSRANYNQPGSTSTQMDSDINHDVDRLKPNCQRNLDFFDFPQEMYCLLVNSF